MDTSMKSRNLLSAFLCIFSYSILVLAKPSCDAVTYGTPLAKDCFDLVLQLPGGNTSPTINVDALRSFVEPKFLRPEFAPVNDPFKTEMVQLPKLWKKGTCCLALLSIATPGGVVQAATSVDKWRTVQDAFIDTVQVCLIQGQGKGSGGMLFANMRKPDAKVVYVYARGSQFEESVNRYMSSYKQGLDPYNPNAILLDSAPANSSVTERAATSSLKPYVIEKKVQIA